MSKTDARGASATQRRKRAMRAHRALRYAVQLLFFVMAPGLFSGAFNGVKYIFGQIGAVQGIEPTSFVLLLVGVIAFTVVFGRFFCGYACAFGALGDYLYSAFEFLRSKTPLPRVQFPTGLVRVLSLLKYAVLVGICAACVIGVWGEVSPYSPWVAFAGFTSLNLADIRTGAFVVLAVLAVCMIVRERFFCQFLCPLGALFSLLPVLGVSDFTRTREHCARNCGRCKEGCPVDIWPDADALEHGECISCGRCADACPMSNVNFVAIEKSLAGSAESSQSGGESQPGAQAVAGARSCADSAEGFAVRAAGKTSGAEGQGRTGAAGKPLRKTREGWHLVRGNGAGLVLVKALLLLIACWALGATRYLPLFPFV